MVSHQDLSCDWLVVISSHLYGYVVAEIRMYSNGSCWILESLCVVSWGVVDRSRNLCHHIRLHVLHDKY